MIDILFIQEFYFYLIIFLCGLIFLSLNPNSNNRYWNVLINVILILFAAFTVNYIGSRDVNIGVDTVRYKRSFEFYEYAKEFEILKDPFYDYISYGFAKFLDFQALLLFCAFLYVFGALFGFRKVFKNNYYLPFLLFLISPYFLAWGVNVMRSGVAASLFLVGLGVYYNKGRVWKILPWLIGSVLFHFSMFLPLFFFYLTRYVKNTKVILLCWFASIVLGFFKINIIYILVSAFDVFIKSRMDYYVVNEGDRVFWDNFLIFGFLPVVFAVYNILVLNYKNEFYKRLVNTYMLTHIPYIILINSQFGLRLGYLAEFMLPIILIYPLIINPVIKIKYVKLKLSIIIFIVFMIKAYKILIL